MMRRSIERSLTISLTGTVNAQLSPTTVYFEYGTTTSYGSTVNYPNILTSSFNSSVPTPVTGLLPATLYNYRVVAVNACGTVYGLNQSFTSQGGWECRAAIEAAGAATGSG